LLEGCQFSPASSSNKNSIRMKMRVGQRLNETGRGGGEMEVLGETPTEIDLHQMLIFSTQP
jgi:hypothetical protein